MTSRPPSLLGHPDAEVISGGVAPGREKETSEAESERSAVTEPPGPGSFGRRTSRQSLRWCNPFVVLAGGSCVLRLTAASFDVPLLPSRTCSPPDTPQGLGRGYLF